jgi:hypothetical protein
MIAAEALILRWEWAENRTPYRTNNHARKSRPFCWDLKLKIQWRHHKASLVSCLWSLVSGWRLHMTTVNRNLSSASVNKRKQPINSTFHGLKDNVGLSGTIKRITCFQKSLQVEMNSNKVDIETSQRQHQSISLIRKSHSIINTPRLETLQAHRVYTQAPSSLLTTASRTLHESILLRWAALY